VAFTVQAPVLVRPPSSSPKTTAARSVCNQVDRWIDGEG